MPAFRYGKKKSSERRTVCWREVDSNHRFRREGDGPGERSRGRPLSSLETTCDLSSLSVRDLLSATAERPFARAGPMVRPSGRALPPRIGRLVLCGNPGSIGGVFSPLIRTLKERTERERFDHAVDRAAPESASQSGRFCCGAAALIGNRLAVIVLLPSGVAATGGGGGSCRMS